MDGWPCSRLEATARLTCPIVPPLSLRRWWGPILALLICTRTPQNWSAASLFSPLKRRERCKPRGPGTNNGGMYNLCKLRRLLSVSDASRKFVLLVAEQAGYGPPAPPPTTQTCGPRSGARQLV